MVSTLWFCCRSHLTWLIFPHNVLRVFMNGLETVDETNEQKFYLLLNLENDLSNLSTFWKVKNVQKIKQQNVWCQCGCHGSRQRICMKTFSLCLQTASRISFCQKFCVFPVGLENKLWDILWLQQSEKCVKRLKWAKSSLKAQRIVCISLI